MTARAARRMIRTYAHVTDTRLPIRVFPCEMLAPQRGRYPSVVRVGAAWLRSQGIPPEYMDRSKDK